MNTTNKYLIVWVRDGDIYECQKDSFEAADSLCEKLKQEQYKYSVFHLTVSFSKVYGMGETPQRDE